MSGDAWIVVVYYSDYSTGEDSDDMYGPFRSRETAVAFRDRVRAALPEMNPEMNGNINVDLRSLDAPRLRPIMREAERFLADVDSDFDDSGYTSQGMYSIDHAG